MAEMLLYNGVKLPELPALIQTPEWDKEYAYMAIFHYADVSYKNAEYKLIFSKKPFLYDAAPKTRLISQSDYRYRFYLSEDGRRWIEKGELVQTAPFIMLEIYDGHTVVWTNHDIKYQTSGSIYLAASEPAPVPGVPVFLPVSQFCGIMAGQRIAGQRRPKVPDISDALVNISMDNGVNLAGDAAYNASVSNGGAFADGKFVVDGSGALTIPADFMAGTQPWTVAFTIDSYVLNSAKTYCRVARGNQDVPSIFYMTSRGKHHAKLATKTISSSNVAWYDPAFFTVYPSSGALEFDIASSEATTFVFRNDGIYISFWVNGVMVAKQAASGYTTAYQASAFSIGDDAAVGSDMTYMACSMLKAWNRALTDREIKLL